MPLTPTNMRVVDVARLLNSTSQGFVLAQARLYRQFNRVGFRIAATENTRNINLIKYIAWLCDERHAPAEEIVSTGRSYEERKEAERQRNTALSAVGRDIAPLPEVWSRPGSGCVSLQVTFSVLPDRGRKYPALCLVP